MPKQRSLVFGDEQELVLGSPAKPPPAASPTPTDMPAEFLPEEPAELKYMTVVGFVSLYHLSIPQKDLSAHGKFLSRHCKEHNLPLKPIADARWGKVNAYPLDVLKKHFNVK